MLTLVQKSPLIPAPLAAAQLVYTTKYLPLINTAVVGNNTFNLNKITHEIILDPALPQKGIFLQKLQESIQSGFVSGTLTDRPGLEPSQFFIDNGKVPPTDIDTRSANPDQPISSTLEVVVAGIYNMVVPNQKVKIVRTQFSVDKKDKSTHYQNSCDQSRGDYEVEVTLANNEKFYYRTDCKVTSFDQISGLLSDDEKSQRFVCNVYFVGGLSKKIIFTHSQTQYIALVATDRANTYAESKDPVAMKVSQENMPFIDLFDKTRSSAELYKVIGGPQFLSAEQDYPAYLAILKDIPRP